MPLPRSPRSRGRLLLSQLLPALAAAVACGCGGSGDEPPAPAGEPGAGAPAAGAAGGPEAGGTPEGAPLPELRFVDAAAEAGIDVVTWCGSERDTKLSILESIGQGAAWLDDDRDGLLDLFVVNGSSTGALPDPPPTSRYYANLGDGRFADHSATAGVDDAAWGNGVAAADFDNDGDTDLFVTNWGPHILYENLSEEGGRLRFRDVGAEAGVRCDADSERRWGAGAAWGDVDRDGFLDLYVCHYLWFDPENPPNGGRTQNWKGVRDAYYGPLGCIPQDDVLLRNLGDRRFEDVSESSGVAAAVPTYSLGAIFTDYDLDGDADIYVANDSMPNYLFENDGDGVFEERGELLGLAYGEQGNAQAGMGLDAADWNRDGRDDLLVTNFDDDVNTLYENRGKSFRDVTVRTGLAALSRNLLCWGCALIDFDHDADLDVFIATGHVYPRTETDDATTSYLQLNQLLLQENGRLVEPAGRGGPAFDVREVSRGTAFGDYDADGDVDFVVINLNRPPTLYRNDSRNLGRWLQVRLAGTRSNRDGVGARVTVRAGELELSRERRAGASFLSTSSPWLHFGLGRAARVDEVRVRWPSGAETVHGPFEVDRRVVLEESE